MKVDGVLVGFTAKDYLSRSSIWAFRVTGVELKSMSDVKVCCLDAEIL